MRLDKGASTTYCTEAIPGIATSKINGVDVEQLKGLVRSIEEDPSRAKSTWKAKTIWKEGGYVETQIRDFTVQGDEPDELLGTERAPNAVEAVLHALGACLAVCVVYGAATRGIIINALEFDVTGELDTRGFLGLSDDVRPGYQNVTVRCRIDADAPPDALNELWEHAQKISPVLDIVRNPVPVSLVLETGEE